MKLESVVPTSLRGKSRPRLLLKACVGAIIMVALVISLASSAFAASSFPDVPASHQYYTAITDLADRGIISGYTDGRFGPGDLVMRQQFAKMIVLTGGYPVSEATICPFTDVEDSGAASLYPDNYIAVAAAHAITVGKTATRFDPYSNITRLQVITMVVRTADDLQPGLLVNPPVGWTATGTWGNDPTHGANAARAQYNGLLDGLNLASLNPLGNMPRGEVALVLHNLLGKLGPAAITYSLSTSASPAASGSVTRSPDQAAYDAGSSVTLTAVPATGYVFLGWSGDAGGATNPLTMVMDADKTIVANFISSPPVLLQLMTSVSPAGGGAVNRSPDQMNYAPGTSVSLTAVPATGYVFDGWSGDAGGTTNPLTVIMDTAKSITANFSAVAPGAHYEDLGISVGSSPAVASWQPGRLDIFWISSGGALYHRTYSGGSWSSTHNRFGNLKVGSKPAAVSWGYGRIDVLARGADDHLWWIYYNGAWSTWTDLGAILGSSPALCSTEPGRLEAFWCTAAGGLAMRRYTGGSWAGSTTLWPSLTTQIKPGSSPAVVSWGTDVIDIFTRGSNNHLWHRYYDGSWSTWTDLGGTLNSDPAASTRGPGHLDVFWRGPGNTLWRTYGPGADPLWSTFAQLNDTAFLSDPAAVSWGSNRIDVIVRGSNNHLWHTWWDGSGWRP